jgi:nucleoside-diphosphate-sugar epimerase
MDMGLRVFLTGATGFVGSAICDRLVGAGMVVIALTRRPEACDGVVAAGAQPLLGDLGAPETWIQEASTCDVVVHAGQQSMGFPISAESVTATAAVDGVALDGVLKAAARGRVRQLLYTSGLWSYGDHGDEWITEHTPLAPLGIDLLRGEREERLFSVAGELGVRACVMTLGNVYGPGRSFSGYVERARAGQHSYHGEGQTFMSPVHHADVANAYMKAIELSIGGERFNICDDEPLRAREHAEALCVAVGSAPPRSMPKEEAIAILGPLHVRSLGQSIRMSNRKARDMLGWTPSHPSFRAGVVQAVRSI